MAVNSCGKAVQQGTPFLATDDPTPIDARPYCAPSRKNPSIRSREKAMMPVHHRAHSTAAVKHLARAICIAAAMLIGAPALSRTAQAGDIPSFAVDASWPKPLPNNWIIGHIIVRGFQDECTRSRDSKTKQSAAYTENLVRDR
jgi:hypothetical protein